VIRIAARNRFGNDVALHRRRIPALASVGLTPRRG
jgi:hypothetical protein